MGKPTHVEDREEEKGRGKERERERKVGGKRKEVQS